MSRSPMTAAARGARRRGRCRRAICRASRFSRRRKAVRSSRLDLPGRQCRPMAARAGEWSIRSLITASHSHRERMDGPQARVAESRSGHQHARKTLDSRPCQHPSLSTKTARSRSPRCVAPSPYCRAPTSPRRLTLHPRRPPRRPQPLHPRVVHDRGLRATAGRSFAQSTSRKS